MAEISVEEKYKSMSEIDHILHRPGMYVGSTKAESKDVFLYSHDEAKMEQKNIKFVPAIFKCFDEIISNSCDEFRRESNLGLTRLEVFMCYDGRVIVKDNGGIPVVMHNDAGCYVPEFIFGRFRTSSNYDDSQDRDVVGTNGVGSKYCNVFSEFFKITTADGHNKFSRSWKNNMHDIQDDLNIEPSTEHFLETRFKLDFSKFGDVEEFGIDFARLIEKRCIDAAAANPGLGVSFTYMGKGDEKLHTDWSFQTFEEYIEMYSDYVDQSECISFATDKQSVWVYPDGNVNIGFVNGAECSKGTHIRSLRSDINNIIAQKLVASHNIEVSTKSIDNKYSMFCIVRVSNPAYSSQTKEELTTPADKFDRTTNRKYVIPTDFRVKLEKSEIINIVLDWYKQKVAAEDKKQTRRMNKQLKNKIRNEKFIDCNSRDRGECELWLFEGDSAKSGFRMARNPQTQAAYLLKGVIKNVSGMTPQQVMKHKELADIMSILGLQWGQKNDCSKLRFGRIVIATDADHDGDKIAGLLLVFFNLFPELFEAGMVMRSMSPIITATKGSEIREFFSYKEHKEAENNGELDGWHIKFSKGLGGLAAPEYKKMMQSPKFLVFKKDELADSQLRSWFGKGIASVRKGMLNEDV